MSTRADRATLAQIASAAGVSVSTVSKVVNGRPDVAPRTRALVQQVLHDQSYERRRVGGSRALAADPKVLLLDEPTELLFRSDPGHAPVDGQALVHVGDVGLVDLEIDAEVDVGADLVLDLLPEETQRSVELLVTHLHGDHLHIPSLRMLGRDQEYHRFPAESRIMVFAVLV